MRKCNRNEGVDRSKYQVAASYSGDKYMQVRDSSWGFNQIVPSTDSHTEGEKGTLLETLVQETMAGSVPVTIVNSANKTMRVSPDTELGKAVVVDLRRRVKYEKEKRIKRNKEDELMVPKEFKGRLPKLLNVNEGAMTNSDEELGRS